MSSLVVYKEGEKEYIGRQVIDDSLPVTDLKVNHFYNFVRVINKSSISRLPTANDVMTYPPIPTPTNVTDNINAAIRAAVPRVDLIAKITAGIFAAGGAPIDVSNRAVAATTLGPLTAAAAAAAAAAAPIDTIATNVGEAYAALSGRANAANAEARRVRLTGVSEDEAFKAAQRKASEFSVPNTRGLLPGTKVGYFLSNSYYVGQITANKIPFARIITNESKYYGFNQLPTEDGVPETKTYEIVHTYGTMIIPRKDINILIHDNDIQLTRASAIGIINENKYAVVVGALSLGYAGVTNAPVLATSALTAVSGAATSVITGVAGVVTGAATSAIISAPYQFLMANPVVAITAAAIVTGLALKYQADNTELNRRFEMKYLKYKQKYLDLKNLK